VDRAKAELKQAGDTLERPATHVRFALKVTLAAMTCYAIYTGLGWPGIHAAFITCGQP
jgi:multidrug resistance protein MdtO